jgi:hypothetical protein
MIMIAGGDDTPWYGPSGLGIEIVNNSEREQWQRKIWEFGVGSDANNELDWKSRLIGSPIELLTRRADRESNYTRVGVEQDWSALAGRNTLHMRLGYGSPHGSFGVGLRQGGQILSMGASCSWQVLTTSGNPLVRGNSLVVTRSTTLGRLLIAKSLRGQFFDTNGDAFMLIFRIDEPASRRGRRAGPGRPLTPGWGAVAMGDLNRHRSIPSISLTAMRGTYSVVPAIRKCGWRGSDRRQCRPIIGS